MNQPALKKSTQLVMLTALVASTAACAGPRGGYVGGYPNSTTATVQARVVSSSPVMAQVAVPRQVCYDELRQEPARSSGAGAIVGAIAGGAMGNSVGKGTGRAVATGLGVILGAAVGDRIENDGRPGVMRSVQRCEQQTSYQNQVVAYNVVYEYGGQRYSTQMQNQPGSTIPITVTVNPGDDRSYRYESAPVYQSYQPAPVVVAPPVRYAPAPVTTVVHRPVIIREVDYVRPVIGYVPPRHGHRHQHEERCDERDDGRGHRHQDDGRARWSSRWN